MKLRARYYYYEWKRILKYIPQMLIGAIVLVLMAGAIAFCAVQIFTDTDAAPKVRVAFVVDDQSDSLSLLVDFIGSMKSTENSFIFQEMSLNDAQTSLDHGDISAVMILPQQVISGIMDGSNRHIQVILSDHDPLSAILLQELAMAGAKILSSAQAGTYTMTELYINAGLSDSLSAAYTALDLRNLQYALVRDDLFRCVSADPTGKVPVTSYYLASGLIFFFLMLGTGCVIFYDKGSKSRALKLKSVGIGTLSECFSHFLGILFYQLIPALLVCIPFIRQLFLKSMNLKTFGGLVFLLLIFLLASCSYLFFLLEASSTAAFAVIFIFSVTILMMLVCGCFIPTGLMPSALISWSRYLPAGDMMQQWFHILSYLNKTSYQYGALFDHTCLRLLMFTLLFYAAGVLIHGIRRRTL